MDDGDKLNHETWEDHWRRLAVGNARDLRDRDAVIARVRALLTSGPVSPRHMPFTAGACANDEWVAAIRKALGE